VKGAAGLRRIHGHLLLAALGLVLARPGLATNAVGAVVVAAGMALRVWAAGVLDKGGELCTDGPYRCVRHPLYVGSFVAAVGFCVMMRAVWASTAVLLLFAVLYAAQVSMEERLLRAQYGERYAEYAAKVPKVAPRLWRRVVAGGRRWSLSRVLMNREQYHVLVTLLLVGLFYAKWYWLQ